MISEEKIEKHKQIFEEKNKEYGIFTKELSAFLGEDFFLAPASPSLDMFGAYPGGLLDHLLRMCKYAIKINEILPPALQVEKKTIVRTAFLSEIGKTFLFKLNEDEFTRKKGKMYAYRDDEMVIMNVGERSIYYATKYGVQLSEEEYQAILNFDKEPNERFVKSGSKPLFRIMKMGYELALMEEKNGKTGH